MTFEERVAALQPLGFTPRQTRFLVHVALHSGYCLRRQYTTFAAVRYGKNVRDFLDGLVARGLALRFTYRSDRGHVYHVHARSLYRAIGQEDNRNRRHASPALIARKLMLLDFVLSLPAVDWYATEEDKVSLFITRFDVPLVDLPRRVYEAAGQQGDRTIRYFIDKLPIYVDGDPPTVHFVYLATGGNAQAFEHFLRDHARLFGRLSAWSVVCVHPGDVTSELPLEAVFRRSVMEPCGLLSRPDMEQYFSAKRAVERDDFAHLSVEDLGRFRAARRRFETAELERLYLAWLERGSEALDDIPAANRSTGLLSFHVLPHAYEQFGSLAGVA